MDNRWPQEIYHYTRDQVVRALEARRLWRVRTKKNRPAHDTLVEAGTKKEAEEFLRQRLSTLPPPGHVSGPPSKRPPACVAELIDPARPSIDPERWPEA